MNCPSCNGENTSYVIDTRHRNDGVYRRRKCSVCGYRFSTHERVVDKDKIRRTKVTLELTDAERDSFMSILERMCDVEE